MSRRCGARDRARIFKKDALPFAAALEAGATTSPSPIRPMRSRQLDRLIEIWQAVPFARILTVEHAVTHTLPPGGLRHVFQETAITTYRHTDLPA